jgi:hypothetical protein
MNVRKITATCSAAIITGALLIAHSYAGPVWEENVEGGEDAGSLPGTSQTTEGNGQLTGILGRLEGGGILGVDFEDMFRIRICDPEAFLASTHPTDSGDADFDTQLWVFEPLGEPGLARGRLGNNNKFEDDPRAWLLPVPTDGSPPLTEPGIYYIAISGQDNIPSGKGEDIFFLATPTEISGPDGGGGQFPITGWMTGPEPAVGTYLIALEGVTFGDDPFIDCNENGRSDACDIAFGESSDINDNGIPDECECIGDLNGDLVVNVFDLLLLLGDWDLPGGPADLNADGIIDVIDLQILIASWGECA